MQIIVKYVRRDKTEREVHRTQVMLFPPDQGWGAYAEAALESRKPGERIIAVIEAGYH